MSLQTNGVISASTGVTIPLLIQYAIKYNLGGLEYLWGIPGSLGGAIYMNAGAYGVEIGDIVKTVTYYDLRQGKIIVSPKVDLSFSYRHSIFQKGGLHIVSATIGLTERSREKMEETVEEIQTRRKATQPLSLPNAGSVFRHTSDGTPASRMIDEAGCKGLVVGGAMVSVKHAGFIVNTGSATAQDVKDLIELVRERVHKRFVVLLATEIEYW
jgi:UDP-N-acetylmuramate dehydrogenase